MATANTPTPPPASRPVGFELLGPLAAASRGEPNSRVRSLEEARRSLRIPNTSDPEVLRAWGTPTDFQLAVYAVEEAEAPRRVAEFALLRVVKREGHKLVAGDRATRLRLAEKSNALWIVYGSITVASDGSLVIESLAVGPAFEDQLSREGDDIALGITSQLLRLLSPPRILAACAERLLAEGNVIDAAAEPSAPRPCPAIVTTSKTASTKAGHSTPSPATTSSPSSPLATSPSTTAACLSSDSNSPASSDSQQPKHETAPTGPDGAATSPPAAAAAPAPSPAHASSNAAGNHQQSILPDKTTHQKVDRGQNPR